MPCYIWHELHSYPLVRPTLEYASAVCDLYTTTQTVSLIISKTNRTVTRHSITCKQLCHVHSACSGQSSWLSGTPATRRRHFIQITWGGGGVGYLCVAIQSLVAPPVDPPPPNDTSTCSPQCSVEYIMPNDYTF